MSDIQNPFVVTKSIPEDLFCDREAETAFLLKQVSNGRNVVLTSPRRMGKTQLIHHLFLQPEVAEAYRTFFVDLYPSTSLQDFCYLFGKCVFDQLKPKARQHWEQLFQALKSLRTAFRIDPLSGEPSFEISLGAITTPDTTLEEIFAYLETSDTPCIVAFDEFQQIAAYADKRVEALLRSLIQRCSRTSFLFSGSQQHTIGMMFHSKSRPFYQSAQMMDLQPLGREVYTAFAQRLFAQRGKQLDEQVVHTIHDQYHGTTWYMQMLMNELFALTPSGTRCTAESLPLATRNIIEAQQDTYKAQLAMLSTRQKALLQAIAQEGAVKSPTASAFIKGHSLESSSSVQAAMKALLAAEIVSHDTSGYRIADFFFSRWIKESY